MTKGYRYQGGTEFAHSVGSTLRLMRTRKGLTQAQLAAPFTAAFVSSVEHGRIVPSLPALRMLTERLELSMHEFFGLVERDDPA
jgi:transcriptional regulator with XRE-family HTH domain